MHGNHHCCWWYIPVKLEIPKNGNDGQADRIINVLARDIDNLTTKMTNTNVELIYTSNASKQWGHCEHTHVFDRSQDLGNDSMHECLRLNLGANGIGIKLLRGYYLYNI